MCEFCEVSQEEKDGYYDWARRNPYNGYKQVIEEGVDYLLDKHMFRINAKFDGGYLGDSKTIIFNYCPKCGRELTGVSAENNQEIKYLVSDDDCIYHHWETKEEAIDDAIILVEDYGYPITIYETKLIGTAHEEITTKTTIDWQNE